VSVAVAAEALLSTCEWENDDSEGFIGVDTTSSEVENLFNLRQDAIIRASEILSSFVNTKPNKAKKLKERDANADETGSSKKKKSKRSKKNDEEELDNENDKVTTTEVNRTVQAKNKKLIEDAISSITPALSQDFLSKSLREFGARAEKTDEVRL
jgi:phage I-like protein